MIGFTGWAAFSVYGVEGEDGAIYLSANGVKAKCAFNTPMGRVSPSSQQSRLKLQAPPNAQPCPGMQPKNSLQLHLKAKGHDMLSPFLVSWWDDLESGFNFIGPVWVDERRDHRGMPQLALSAAVMAGNEEHAKEQVTRAYAYDVELEWRSIEQQPYGWEPLNQKQLKDSGYLWSQRHH